MRAGDPKIFKHTPLLTRIPPTVTRKKVINAPMVPNLLMITIKRERGKGDIHALRKEVFVKKPW